MDKLIQITKSEEETLQLGSEFASFLNEGDIVAISGTLGSGKTVFIKGICNYFDVKEIVNSPTFTIINQYNGIKDGKETIIYHIDLYRINAEKELDEIGFKDCIFSEDAIKLIEWADKIPELINIANYSVKITQKNQKENERQFTITKNQTTEK